MKTEKCSTAPVCFLLQAIMSIPGEEQREEALTQLNKAALQLCVEQKPTQSDLLYPLWWVTFARKSF